MLFVGTNTDKLIAFLNDFDEDYLLIDDGQIIDVIRPRKAVHFDLENNSFNFLAKPDELAGETTSAIIGGAFPAGATTLTKENGLDEIEKAIDQGGRNFARLIPKPLKTSTPEEQWAYRKIQKLLRNRVLKNVLLGKPNFGTRYSFFDKLGTILVRLNPAEIGDKAAYVLGNIFAMKYKGHVVFTDYGFYKCSFHTSLIRQGRFTGQVTSLRQLPDDLYDLLIVREKEHAHCTYRDAETLAEYEGLRPDPARLDNDYNKFIDAAIKG